jgi:hypothetical protein
MMGRKTKNKNKNKQKLNSQQKKTKKKLNSLSRISLHPVVSSRAKDKKLEQKKTFDKLTFTIFFFVSQSSLHP